VTDTRQQALPGTVPLEIESSWQHPQVRFVSFFLGLLLVNNFGMAWAGLEPERRLALDVVQLLMCGVVVLWARVVEHLSLGQLGFRVAQPARSLVGGLAVGLGMGATACVLLAHPVVVAPIHYAGYASLGLYGSVAISFGRLLLVHALLEETLFRGLILTRATDWWGPRRGLAISAGLFVLWHPVLTYQVITQSTFANGPGPAWLWLLLAILPLTIGGLFFAWMRQRSGGLVAPIAAHWAVNSVILVYLARLG
jgi:uncharacterized protein